MLTDDAKDANKIPVNGFFHIAGIGKWKSITNEIVKEILHSPLYKALNSIELVFLGTKSDFAFLKQKFNYPKFKLTYDCEDLRQFEYPTLNRLHEFSKTNNGYVFYIHTKGASKTQKDFDKKSVYRNIGVKDLEELHRNVSFWRRYMTYFIIRRCSFCMESLKDHDICGVEWGKRGKAFNGNFWWARTEHVRTLPRPPQSDRTERGRYPAEFWIGHKPKVKIKCMFSSGHIGKELFANAFKDYRKIYL